MSNNNYCNNNNNINNNGDYQNKQLQEAFNEVCYYTSTYVDVLFLISLIVCVFILF